MRKGFSLIFAIVFIMLIATIGALSLNIVSLGVKDTSDLYLEDQADLFAQSATEFAILAIHEHDYSKNCLNTVRVCYPKACTDKDAMLEANVTIKYIAKDVRDKSGGDTEDSYFKGCAHFVADKNGENDKISAVQLYTSVATINDFADENIKFTRVTTQIP